MHGYDSSAIDDKRLGEEEGTSTTTMGVTSQQRRAPAKREQRTEASTDGTDENGRYDMNTLTPESTKSETQANSTTDGEEKSHESVHTTRQSDDTHNYDGADERERRRQETQEKCTRKIGKVMQH